ncbi:MAG: hypothetical protein JXB34_02270 [Bacteroidales bacterium]|nr:hypothetical protein [Bacteroidales bacterium]
MKLFSSLRKNNSTNNVEIFTLAKNEMLQVRGGISGYNDSTGIIKK